jgi:Protein of unknown function (DUF4019)
MLVLSICLTSPWAHAEDTPEQRAQTATEVWLGYVDAGNYANSWREASAYFQGVVTASAWAESLNGIRKPLGKVVSRILKSARHTTSLPGAPDGNYVVVQFDTRFEA